MNFSRATRDAAFYGDHIDSIDELRNSSVVDQLPALKRLFDKHGIKGVRVGASVLPPRLEEEYLFDYSLSGYRSELFDLMLMRDCRYMISTGSGIDELCLCFRKKVVYVNLVSWSFMLYRSSLYHPLFLPQLWLNRSGQLVRFEDVCKLGFHDSLALSNVISSGYSPVENTPEEITEIVCELEAVYTNTLNYSTEDDDLQRRFWEAFGYKYKVTLPRIGRNFLKSYSHLL